MTTLMALVITLSGLGGQTTPLTVDVSPKDATLHLDGKPIQAGRAVPVSAGRHTLKATRKGYKSQSKTIIAKGKAVRVSIILGAQPQASEPTAPRGKKPIARERKPPVRRGGARTIAPVRDERQPSGGTLTRDAQPKPPADPIRDVRVPDRRVPDRGVPDKKPAPREADAAPRRADNGAKGYTPGPRRRRVPPREVVEDRTRKNDAPPPDGGQASGRTTRQRGSLKPLAVVSFLIGGAAIVGGVVTGKMADDAADDFNASRFYDKKINYKQEAEDLSLGSNVLYGVGAVGIGLGALLWGMDSAYQASVAPMPGGGAYVGVGGSF
ncbi:hypothetical protein KKF91_17620 [Myxococcota bacterium]|nr:hypothetical protein [Myxococcota bacterium]MBU1432361.1 hypothetical protein [Myxococcota bacterium]MBU1900310.1 hypothetical protein [Myxococcota bacterium]